MVIIHASSYMYERLERRQVKRFVSTYLSCIGARVFNVPIEAVEIRDEGAIGMTVIQAVLPFEADAIRIDDWTYAIEEDLFDQLRRTFFMRGVIKASVTQT